MKQEHEMTPGVLVSGDDMSAGDYKARCAVLEYELAELRKRVCVPDGWRVFAPTSTTLHHGERWEVYGPNGGGIVNADNINDWAVRGLLDAIAAAPAPVERVDQAACTGKNCGSTDPKLHSAECFAEHEQAIAPTAAQDVAGLIEALTQVANGDYTARHDDNDSDILQNIRAEWYELKRIARNALSAHQSGGAK